MGATYARNALIPLNYRPCDPNPFEPVPRLVNLMLVIGQFGAYDGDGGHEAGHDGADARDSGVDVPDDAICHRPHIFNRRESGDGEVHQHKQDYNKNKVDPA